MNYQTLQPPEVRSKQATGDKDIPADRDAQRAALSELLAQGSCQQKMPQLSTEPTVDETVDEVRSVSPERVSGVYI